MSGPRGSRAPELRRIDLRGDPEAPLEDVVEHLRRGGVVAYPTETVYGLGCGMVPNAIERIRSLKGREGGKPFIVLVEDASAVDRLAWTPAARELAALFWPGSVTLVLEDPERVFPKGVRDPERGTVAVRVSPHPTVRRLLSALGAPLLSTSLNRAGEPAVSVGSEAARLVQDLGAYDVVVLDAGTLPPSGPSTVVDCTGPTPAVLREGAVPTGRLRCAIPEIHERSN